MSDQKTSHNDEKRNNSIIVFVCMFQQAVVAPKAEAPAPVHEDLYDTAVEPVASWAEDSAPPPPAAAFGAPPAQEDWAAQVNIKFKIA